MKNLKEYWSIIVIAVGLVSNIAVGQYQIGELKSDVKQLKEERDIWLKMQAKQEDLIKTVEEQKNDTKAIYRIVIELNASSKSGAK